MPPASPRSRPIYDSLAADYDRALAPFERRFISRWRGEALAALPAEARLLEIGAGTGLNFSHYPRATRCAVATDVSGAMLAQAQKKFQDVRLSKTLPLLVRNSAEQLPCVISPPDILKFARCPARGSLFVQSTTRLRLLPAPSDD